MNTLRLIALATLLAPTLSHGQAIGPFLDGALPAAPPGTATGWRTENAFPNVTFNSPFKILPDPTGPRFFVAEKRGRLSSFATADGGGDKREVLNIEQQVSQGGGTHGFMGFALHPEFADPASPNAGFLYIWYRYIPDPTRLTSDGDSYRRLSRFTVDLASGVADPASETVLIQQFTRSRIHTGGGMFFGPDGFLYLSVGDEGTCCEQDSTQRIDRWLFGGVLRIDVDQRGDGISHPIRRQPTQNGDIPPGWPPSFTAHYFVPDDNPWQDPTGGVLEEFYAIGLRHGYTLAYDPPTGDIWEGDVGEATWEEVNKVVWGANYEWPFLEADRVHRARLTYEPTTIDDVIGERRGHHIKLNRATSNSVIGGFVYRGDLYPELQGRFLFADHASGRIYSVDAARPGGMTQDDVALLTQLPDCSSGFGVASFATDDTGAIYVVKLDGVNVNDDREGGTIHRVVPEDESNPDPPARLSDLGAFADLETLTAAPGLRPYTVNTPLWSDGALKRRWLALPNDGDHDTAAERIDFHPDAPWGFPVGTVMMKHFELAASPAPIRLETRFLTFTEAGPYGVTYRWNEDGTDAVLLTGRETRDLAYLDPAGDPVEQVWTFPGRDDCLQCHTAVAGTALGVNTQQLNGAWANPDTGAIVNQIEALDALDALRPRPGDVEDLPRSVALDDDTATPTARVFSYLDANCAGCHRPAGVEGAFDARLVADFAAHRLVNQRNEGENSDPAGVVVAPGDVAASELYRRDAAEDGSQMPPLGRSLLDPTWLATLAPWIRDLAPPPPWQARPAVEVGVTTTGGAWTRVAFTHRWEDPVVVTGAPSYADATAAAVRVRGVGPDGFEVRVARFACDSDTHGEEAVPWLVVEAGETTLPDGRRLVAGRADGVVDAWQAVELPAALGAAPTVLATLEGDPEAPAVAVRYDANALTPAGFALRVQREEDGPAPAAETVAWVAIEPGADAGRLPHEAGHAAGVTNTFVRVDFQQPYAFAPLVFFGPPSFAGSDPGTLRFDATTSTGRGAHARVREEGCGDGERTHAAEAVGFAVFERPGVVFAPCGEDCAPLPCPDPDDGGACPPDAGAPVDAGLPDASLDAATADASAAADMGVMRDAAPTVDAAPDVGGPAEQDAAAVDAARQNDVGVMVDAAPAPDAAPVDAARPDDVGVVADAAHAPDAATADDAGTPADAARAADAAPPNDAGNPADAAQARDAAPATDAGALADAAPADDAGALADAAPADDAGALADAAPADDAAAANDAGLPSTGDATAVRDAAAPRADAARDDATPRDAGAADDAAGCDCRATEAPREGAPLAWLLAAGLLLTRRRRG